jgi:hypothetical protein
MTQFSFVRVANKTRKISNTMLAIIVTAVTKPSTPVFQSLVFLVLLAHEGDHSALEAHVD